MSIRGSPSRSPSLQGGSHCGGPTFALNRMLLVFRAGSQPSPHGGRSLYEVDYTGPVAILVGGEGSGLPADVVTDADDRVTIAMHAPVESLNAAVATALVLYEARRQRDLHELAVS